MCKASLPSLLTSRLPPAGISYDQTCSTIVWYLHESVETDDKKLPGFYLSPLFRWIFADFFRNCIVHDAGQRSNPKHTVLESLAQSVGLGFSRDRWLL